MNHNNKATRRAAPLPATVRRARELARLTQTKAAELLFTTQRTWAQWEAGQRRQHPAFFELFLTKTNLQNHPELDQYLTD